MRRGEDYGLWTHLVAAVLLGLFFFKTVGAWGVVTIGTAVAILLAVYLGARKVARSGGDTHTAVVWLAGIAGFGLFGTLASMGTPEGDRTNMFGVSCLVAILSAGLLGLVSFRPDR